MTDIVMWSKKKIQKSVSDFYETAFPHTCIREIIYFLQEHYKDKKDLVGAEIGVYLGHNSFNIMKNLPMKKLYLIDPYEPWMENGIMHVEPTLEKKAKRRMRDYRGKVAWIKKPSFDAVTYIPNDLDFIYIDGNHDYEYIKKEIDLYYPKIKSGGVIAGHDCSTSFLGIIKAVTDFGRKNNLEMGGKEVDWWFIKP
jgi:hypothetical protein